MATSQTSPKVFISYSWKPFSNKQKTIQLAERLTNDGVTVVIDEWNLAEGQDKYKFMEQMVNDPEIKRVLLICNKDYSEKANSKKGGVGIESLIVSDDIYKNADQTKFIPVIFEKDAKGEAFAPTFIKTRIFIDLSSNDSFEEEYEKLLRNIFDKPLSRKPALGTPPQYLFEDEPIFLRTAHKVNTIKTALTDEKKNFQIYIDDYYTTFFDALKDFEIKQEELNDYKGQIDELVLKKIEELKILRNDFINFLEVIGTYSFQFNTDKFFSFYEKFLEFIRQLDSNDYPSNTYGYLQADQFRFFSYELLLYTFAVLWETERYKELGELLHTNFVIMDKRGSETEVCSFTSFNIPIEAFRLRNDRLQLRRYSITADIVKQRADHPKYNFDKLKEYDTLLYYLAILKNKDANQVAYHNWSRWWPYLTVYSVHRLIILQKLVSKRYFEKVKPVFGVTSLADLKTKVQHAISIKADKLLSHEYEFPALIRAFDLDKISTIE